jgi:diguanylate cyclase (GGDEF)-like protein
MVLVQARYASEMRRELAQQIDVSERNGALAGMLNDAGEKLQQVNAQLAVKNTELEHAMENLNRLVTVDHLTGAYTRRFVFDQMEREASSKARHGTPLSVIMLDLDHFKAVNDRYGHPVGDRALQAVALAVTGQLRDGDILARVGGEEFLVLLPMTGLAAAMQLAERLRQTLAATTITEGQDQIALPASFGVAELHEGEDLSAWYQRLDATLYKAKSQGRNALAAAI